jgi:glycosyltransferase involved in cell wall biosynthesis
LRSGIDRERYVARDGAREATRRALGYAPDDVVVGSLACLKAQKAPLDFVAAAGEALRSDPRLRFFIAGDGELREAVEREIASRGLGDRFRLLGWRQDVPDVLASMDLFVLTSKFEGLPRAVLQAMAAGVPVVATSVGGTPEVVRDGVTGRLVPPGDPAAAANAIVGLAADPALRARCVAEAQARLDEAFDIRRMVADLDRLYLRLLEKPKTT